MFQNFHEFITEIITLFATRNKKSGTIAISIFPEIDEKLLGKNVGNYASGKQKTMSVRENEVSKQ